MLIAEHPPHTDEPDFSIRLLPWVFDGEALIGLPYAAQRLDHASPDLRPVRALLIRVSLVSRPSLHRLRHRKTSFVRRLHSYYGGVRLLLIVHRQSWSPPSRRGPSTPKGPVADPEISRFPYKELACMPGSSTTPGCPSACDGALGHIAFRYTGLAPRTSFLSRLKAGLHVPLTDASPTSSRMPAHGWGPMWFAIP